jgi:hypothetical protein
LRIIQHRGGRLRRHVGDGTRAKERIGLEGGDYTVISSSDIRLRTYGVHTKCPHAYFYAWFLQPMYIRKMYIRLNRIYVCVIYTGVRIKRQRYVYIHIYIHTYMYVYILYRIKREGHTPSIAYALLLQRYDTP